MKLKIWIKTVSSQLFLIKIKIGRLTLLRPTLLENSIIDVEKTVGRLN